MSEFYKYNRTYHLPWSPGSTSDDKFLHDITPFLGMEIVVTEKMDGENTNMYPNRIHARSIDSNDHPSRHYVKGVWGRIKHDIPEGWRVCGENLYAKHSVFYNDLKSYFMTFSIWDDENMCLSWDDTVLMCEMMKIDIVPVIWRGIFNETFLKELADNFDIEKKEGYVIRNVNSFYYDDFSDNVAKWVRPKHVQTDQHWMFTKIIPNQLKEDENI